MTKRKLTEQDVQLTKQLLQQREAMRRMVLDEPSWIAYRLGCSLEHAERLIEHVKESA